jgi:hypothetical protein
VGIRKGVEIQTQELERVQDRCTVVGRRRNAATPEPEGRHFVPACVPLTVSRCRRQWRRVIAQCDVTVCGIHALMRYQCRLVGG